MPELLALISSLTAREWRIAAFHNTKRQRVMERISFLLSPDTRPAAEK